MGRLVRWAAILAGAGYLLFGAALFARQRSLVFPRPTAVREPDWPGAVLDRVRSAEGTVFVLRAPGPPGAPTIVHFHGNSQQLADTVALGRSEHEAGFGFAAVEYPGYGLARGGHPSERALDRAAARALDDLRDRLSISSRDVVLQGLSLGTGVATEMARRGYGSRLVLISPFTSIEELARRLHPLFPVGLLLLDRFDTLGRARSVSQPVLILHGTADETVPIEMARRLARTFPRATLEVEPGLHHNDILDPGTPTVARIVRFIRGG